jgi:ATP-dependent RNA helicase DDX47/RRP3
MKQVIELSKKPSVIVSTPGRLLDHLTNTKGFSLDNLKFLVLDEADKLLNKDFELQFNEILSKLPT